MTPSTAPIIAPSDSSSSWRFGALIGALVLVFFAAVAPTLKWAQFSADSEDLLVKTVMEMRHDGRWWIPTLGGVPRTRKPPLPAWCAAAAVSKSTIQTLSDPDPRERERAYQQLAWQVRWPSLAAACLMLLAAGWMGKIIGGPPLGVLAVLICGASLLFLRFTRAATTDIYLAAFVTIANAFFAWAMFQNRRFAGLILGGAALGLAFMSKGPVAWIQTLVPFAGFAMRRRYTGAGRESESPYSGPVHRRWWPPLFVGTLVMLAISLPWYISTVVTVPGTLAAWWKELTGEGAQSISHDPWYGYVTLFPNLLPWTALLIAGMFLSLRDVIAIHRAKHPSSPPKPTDSSVGSTPEQESPVNPRIALAFFLVLVPILLMSFSKDRKERYLLPLAGPAAILSAYGAMELIRTNGPEDASAKIVWIAHWGIMALFAIGLPVAATFVLKLPDGRYWYPMAGGIAFLIGAVGVVIGGMLLQRRVGASFVIAPTVLLLACNAFFLCAWSRSEQGLSEMKPVADRIIAAGAGERVIYYDPPPHTKPVTLDLDIYLDKTVEVFHTVPARDAIRATAMVVLWPEKGPAPEFPGWRRLFDLTSRKHHWCVMIPE